MPSKQPPTSVRLGKDRGALVEAYATDHGLKVGAAILALVDLGLQRVTLPVDTKPRAEPKAILAQAEAKAAHLALPKRTKSRWSLKGVPLGPVDQPMGSRLKGTPPRKSKG